MAETKKKNAGRVVIGPVRLSYTYLGKPDYDEDKEKSFYRTMVLVPKKDKNIHKEIDTAIAAAALKFFGKDAKKVMKSPKTSHPMRDPKDEGKDEKAYDGMFFFNAKSSQQPGIMLKDGTKLQDPDEISDNIYAGSWVHASITFYGFENNGNKGVAAAINNVIKYKDDERLDGRVDVEDEMAEYISDDEPEEDEKPKKDKKGKKGKKDKKGKKGKKKKVDDDI